MPEPDAVIADALDRGLPLRQTAGDWAQVARAARSGRRTRVPHARALLVAAVLALVGASAAQAGALDRILAGFTDVLSPAPAPVVDAVQRANRDFATFDLRDEHIAQLELGPARLVARVRTGGVPVTWYAALDRHGRGYCEAGYRGRKQLGGDCQVRDAHRRAFFLATGPSMPGVAVATGLLFEPGESVRVTADGRTRAARVAGDFWIAVVRTRGPLSIAIRTASGALRAHQRFVNAACFQQAVAGGEGGGPVARGFTWCSSGGAPGFAARQPGR